MPLTQTKQIASLNNEIVQEDLQYIFDNFPERDRLKEATILLTGCGGFLGYYWCLFLCHYARELKLKSIIGLDNFQVGQADWMNELKEQYAQIFSFYPVNITSNQFFGIEDLSSVDYVVHMASIASPTFYRQYPVETIDANIWGLRSLLDFYKDRHLRGLLFYSSSEIYGDPEPDKIPTAEDYRGRVSCVGPRACYDESKRFGETLCYVYDSQYHMPIGVVRPFNNYGPGMNINDKRVPADFAKAVIDNQDIIIHSDGRPTRTFCYVADAMIGYLKILTYGRFDTFNIGMDQEEISIRDLAKIYKNAGQKICDYTGEIKFQVSVEAEYLTDNPNRRAADISKARRLLNYDPRIDVEAGVGRYLRYLRKGDNRFKGIGNRE